MKSPEVPENPLLSREIDETGVEAGNAHSPHQEAVQHVEAHRDLFEHYAHGAIHVLPAPEGLDTFAFDLKTNTIYVNSRFYKDLGFSEEKTTFATLHEIEHLLEKVQMLSERGGDKKFTKYLDQIQKSKAFGVMDNCVADIHENRTVVQRTHGGFRDIEEQCYTEDLFPTTDFTEQPLHIQLPYAILREARVPGEPCTVAPEVRQAVDELRAIKSKDGTSLMDVMTHPDTPMSTRLALQNKYVWPRVQELLKKDVEKEKEKSKQEKGEKREGEGKGESDDEEGESDGNDGGGQEQKKEKSKTSKDKKGSGKQTKKETKGGAGQPDPNDLFKDAYAEADRRVPNAVPHDQMKKALDEWKEAKKDDPLLRADKECAERIGVKPEDLRQYRRIVSSLEDIKNPDTNESVIAELRALISKIISERRKPSFAPQYPLEEGEVINDPATLVAEAKSGNLNPKVWETLEVQERHGQKFGEVEITLVCDRSSSMRGDKLSEQRKAAVLFMEALKEFADQAEEERVSLIKPLEIRSEVYTFQQDEGDETPVKRMSKELSEKDRIDTASVLSSAPGGTTDFVPLETIAQGLDPETKKKMSEGELKKIVIVFTDGESNDPSRVKKILEKLRKDGVVTVGVGVTAEGTPALVTYAPDARLAKTATELPLILGELLKEHLSHV
jgi:uncharacterized protein YegL